MPKGHSSKDHLAFCAAFAVVPVVAVAARIFDFSFDSAWAQLDCKSRNQAKNQTCKLLIKTRYNLKIFNLPLAYNDCPPTYGNFHLNYKGYVCRRHRDSKLNLTNYWNHRNWQA